MAKRTRTPEERIKTTIDQVIADCDWIDRQTSRMIQFQNQDSRDLPPLTVMKVETGYGNGWAVVSDDPERPLTERQAESILGRYLAVAELVREWGMQPGHRR